MQSRFPRHVLAALAFLALLPPAARAQSSIVGQLRDQSGAVLPGVTVEASSPALIEKVRIVVTDAQGRYRVVDLRPGVYRLTFTLPGFSTLVREGIELPSEFVATVNADLKVGALEETLTVAGQAPQVDVQQAARTQVLTRDLIDTLPISRNIHSMGVLAAGVRQTTPDIGGSRMTEQVALRAHGQDNVQNEQLVEGMSVQSFEGGSMSYFDEMLSAETSVTTTAQPADTSGGGIRLNSILKDGGNRFSGAIFIGGSDGDWQSDNVDDYLRSRNIQKSNGVAHIQDFVGSMGGPIMKDRLWWLAAGRHVSSDETVANVPEEIVAPNGEVIRSIIDTYVRGPSVRLTWQATPKHKVAGFVQRYWKWKGKDFVFGQDPRAATQRNPRNAHHAVGNIKWTATPTSQWLIEGGYAFTMFHWTGGNQAGQGRSPERWTPAWYAMAERTDTALNRNPDCALADGCTRWMSVPDTRTENTRHVIAAAASYVTGTHHIKVGFSNEFGPDGTKSTRNGDLIQNYAAGRPNTVTVFNTPFEAPGFVAHDLGIYAQDSWRIQRLTLNPGLRVEWFSAKMREAGMTAGRFAPARFYPEQSALPAWGPDYAPRFSAAYDLFGDGRTAIKASVSRYFAQNDAAISNRWAAAASSSDVRNWFDCDINAAGRACSDRSLPTNGDGIAQDNEIGPSSSTAFGSRADRNPAPDFRRPYNWEYTASVQHQLLPGLAVGGGVYRRSYGAIELLDRSLISTSDYTSFQIPMPDFSNDPTLKGVLDPNEILTIYNLNPAKRSVFGSALIDRNSDQDKSIYTGFEASFSARLPRGASAFGSWTAEHNMSVFCESDDNPNGPSANDLYLGSGVANGGRFCDQRNFQMPFLHELKLAGSQPLPYGLEFGAVFQSFAGRERVITYTVPANLFPGGRTNAETIILSRPGSLYQERWNQLDINFKKHFRIGRVTYTGQVDLFNALNNNAIFATNNAIGSSLGQVNQILMGRLPRLAFQMKW